MIIKIKNSTEDPKTWVGQTIEAGEYYELEEKEKSNWANNSTLLSAIADAEAIVNDGTNDITDVNTAINYLKANIPARVIQTLGTDNFSIQPIGFAFTAPKGEASSHDLLLEEAYALKGGVLWAKNPKIGDWIEVQLVDVTNVLGYGEEVVLSNYVKKWMVFPAPALNEVVDISVGILPAPNLFMRVIYHSMEEAEEDSECILNLYGYLVE